MISKKQNGTHRKNFADKQQDEYIQQLKTEKAIAINFMDERTKRLFAGSLYLGAHKILSIANIADICKCSDATVKRGRSEVQIELLSLKEHEQEQKRQYNKINNIVKNKYSNKEDISRPKLVKVRHQGAGRKGHGNTSSCRKKVLNGTTQYAALYKQQINPIYWISNFVIRYYGVDSNMSAPLFFMRQGALGAVGR